MIVCPEDVDARLLQGAEEASSTRRLIVVADPVVVAIPLGFVLEQFHRPQQNAYIVAGNSLVTSLKLRRRWRQLRSLARDLSCRIQQR
jgi:hypothetical protein